MSKKTITDLHLASTCFSSYLKNLTDVARQGDAREERVVSRDPEIHSGDLVFSGTRVPVDTLVDYLKGGYDIGEFLKDFPTVTRWQVESYLEVSSKAQGHCGDNHA